MTGTAWVDGHLVPRATAFSALELLREVSAVCAHHVVGRGRSVAIAYDARDVVLSTDRTLVVRIVAKGPGFSVASEGIAVGPGLTEAPVEPPLAVVEQRELRRARAERAAPPPDPARRNDPAQ